MKTILLTLSFLSLVGSIALTQDAKTNDLKSRIAQLKQTEARLQDELDRTRNERQRLEQQLGQLEVDQLLSSGSALKLRTKAQAVIFAKPTAVSDRLDYIPVGIEVAVLRYASGGMWEVQYGGVRGYVIGFNLDTSDPTVARALDSLSGGKTKYSGSSTPRSLTSTTSKTKSTTKSKTSSRSSTTKGTSTRCLATTKKGTRCKRMTTTGSYCWQHK